MLGDGDLDFLRALVAREGAGVVVDAILPKPDSAYIVAVGNPADGFGFTGPFGGRDAADRWREVNERLLDGDAWIVPLALPDDCEVDPPAPDVIAELRAVVDYAEIINGRQHAGLEIAPVMWSKLHDLCNHAKGVIAEAED
jgi:hypothetical protein